jgi:hypothetical protein
MRLDPLARFAPRGRHVQAVGPVGATVVGLRLPECGEVPAIHRLITRELVTAAGFRPPNRRTRAQSAASAVGVAPVNGGRPSHGRRHQHGCIIRMCRELNFGVERWTLNDERSKTAPVHRP